MQKYDLSKILSCRAYRDISDEEWLFLNSLNFDVLFKESSYRKNSIFDSYNLLSDLVSRFYYLNTAKFEFITHPGNFGCRPIITDKGWAFIKWSILNRFNNICKVIDELLLDEKNLEKKMLIFDIFSLIPANKYGIMISRSKDPGKLFQFMNNHLKLEQQKF